MTYPEYEIVGRFSSSLRVVYFTTSLYHGPIVQHRPEESLLDKWSPGRDSLTVYLRDLFSVRPKVHYCHITRTLGLTGQVVVFRKTKT